MRAFNTISLASLALVAMLSGSSSAAINASVIVSDNVQADGRRYIRERHTDAAGQVVEIVYLAASDTNAASVMAGRVALIDALLKQNELDRNLANALSDSAPAPTIVYSTKLEFGAVLREAFKQSKGRDTVRLGWYISQFNLTDNQLKSLFSLSDAQLAIFKPKLITWTAEYNAMQAEVGE